MAPRVSPILILLLENPADEAEALTFAARDEGVPAGRPNDSGELPR